ncbi:MAG: hypothetical protein ABJC51_10845 [Acidobacteriota bacterium]
MGQRGRRQRVITETVWHYRGMLFNARSGSVGLVGVPSYVLVEVLAPVFEVLAVAVFPLAWRLGMLDLGEAGLLLVALALANGVLTNLAVMSYARGPRSYALRDLLHLMGLGVTDLFVYRPVLIYAQARGLIDFLRGDKAWHKFARNRRG